MAGEFVLEEYKMLRTKAQELIRRIEELERNVVITCGAIFVFSVVTFKTQHEFQRLLLNVLPRAYRSLATLDTKAWSSI